MRNMARELLLAIGIWGALNIFPAVLMAEEKEGLTDLLIRKGVITQEEADQIAKDKEDHPNAKVGSGTLQLDGLLQIWFVHDPKATDSEDTFRLRRGEIKLSGEIVPKIQWTIMVDPAKELKVNKTTTTIGTTTVVEDVSVDQQSKILQELFFRIGYLPYHLVDLGQFKIPVTEEGRRSSAQLDTIERSIIGRTYGDKRDIGFQVTGNFPWVEYRIGLFNGEGINQTDKNNQKDYTGLLIAKPLLGLEVGGSGYRGSLGKSATDRDRYGAELRYQYQDLSFKSEAMWAKDGTTYSNGWYLQLGYFILPKQLQGVVKYEGFDPDQSKSNDKEHDLTIGINYFIKGHNAKTQLNYTNKDFQSARTEKDNNQILAALQIAF